MAALAHKLDLSSWLLFAALVCFSFTGFFLWQRYTPVTLAFNNLPLPADSVITTQSTPALLSIPDLGIHLPIIAATASENHWPVTSHGLIYLADTPVPGAPGNSIIYGHNWPNLLGPVKRAQIGQKILVTSSNNEVKEFIVEKISVVAPFQTQLLAPTDTPVLTLYTCTGFLDTQRLVLTARSV